MRQDGYGTPVGVRAGWNEFASSLQGLVPGLPSDLRPDDRLDSSGRFDELQRVSLRRAFRTLANNAPEELLSSIETLDDARQWCDVRSQQGPDTLDKPDVGPQHLGSRTTFLRPILPPDIPVLYQAALDPRTSSRWRFRGSTPSLAVFSDAIYQGTLAQFGVVDRASGELHGLVAAYNAMHEYGHVHIAFQRVATTVRPRGQMFVGMFIFIDYLFRTWPFRKIYAELPEYNFDRMLHGSTDLFKIEGHLREHYFHESRFWDQFLVATYRDDWEAQARQWWASSGYHDDQAQDGPTGRGTTTEGLGE